MAKHLILFTKYDVRCQGIVFEYTVNYYAPMVFSYHYLMQVKQGQISVDGQKN